MARLSGPVERALLDTSVVIDPPANLGSLTRHAAISTVTLAELAYGLHTVDPVRSAARQVRYDRILSVFDPIPYSASAARMYGGLCAVVRSDGRSPRPRRFDLLLASVAADERLPLLTRNPKDFAGLHPMIQVLAVVG
ncbi:MAG TPA: PIN domain-containing protein [Actinomycetales bacterium]|nr:PIN domain-containing protein [Actinomycetales bacterium]